MTTKVLTANRLLDGVAVWLGSDGQWSLSLRDALLARHEDAIAALEAAGRRALEDNHVIDVNLIEVEETPRGPRPFRLRERIRAEGPSIEYAADRDRVSRAA